MDCAHRSIASAVRGIGGEGIDSNPLRSPRGEEVGHICCGVARGSGRGDKREIIARKSTHGGVNLLGSKEMGPVFNILLFILFACCVTTCAVNGIGEIRRVVSTNERSDVLRARTDIQRGAVACSRIDIELRSLVIHIVGDPADESSVGGDILHRHIDPLTRVSRDGPLIVGGITGERRVAGGVSEVVQIAEIAGAAAEKFCGDRAVGLQCSVAEKILFDSSGLGGEDGGAISGAISGGVEAQLNLRHGLLGGEFGKS